MNRNSFTPKLFTVLKNGYHLPDLRADLIAGLTVAVVALPLAMALAIASGASPDKGLVTAVIAGFLVSLLGGSRVQIGGPTGAFVVVVFTVIAQHGYDGLIMATLMVGLILIVSGYAKLGQIIKFIPYPVITGFTAGIAVIIATSQIKDFLGLRPETVPADFIPKWMAYFEAIGTINPAALLLGLGALAAILLLRRFAPRLPAYLLVIVASALLATLLHLPIETIGSRFPDMPSGLPAPHLPDFSFTKFQEVLPSAFIIAFLAGIEALLSAVVADGMTGFKHRPNQELVGQGVANIMSAIFGGLPATGAIARTATNIKSGGRTPMAGIFHALFLLLFILFATDLMTFVPMAALAAILFIVAWGMSEKERFLHIFRMPGSDRAVLLLTFFLTILVDLTVAIGVGVTLASLLFMARMSKTVKISTQANEAFDLDSEEKEENQRVNLPSGVEVFQIAGPFFFGVADELLETLKRIGQMPRVLIIRMRLVPYLDATGEAALENLVKQCREAGTSVIFSAVQTQPAAMMEKAGFGAAHLPVFYAASYKDSIAMAQDLLTASHIM
ncbi:MAG: sodium-independent anion transporter [Alphaproteobacteria bacterium CG_4_9_14_3_um_filter_47_13]|nr:MAG: sodium-independent anion transporter [Alphaproteobacteria bacterium CG_4_9_14_3_um_filter_47_13]